ncbi:MAG: hypothetical protein LQ351_007143 [Letrouitia transgressa]|nr:MAG: hypothetical protein LQ351_007143 [Letrouitia transgressa]
MRRKAIATSALTLLTVSFLAFTQAQGQQRSLKSSHKPDHHDQQSKLSEYNALDTYDESFNPQKYRYRKDTASNPGKPSALATTVAPAGESRAVRAAHPARGSGKSAGISSPQSARSLQDWEVEDFILLATVDGSIHARDRKTGAPRWELQVDKPMVETVYHPQNESNPNRPEYDFLWIVEPSRNGDIYIYNQGQNRGLQRLHLTVKELVEDMSPYESVDPAVVYNAEKKTKLYTVDAGTGSITKNFGSGGSFTNNDQSCPRNPAGFDGPGDEECGSIGSFVLGRTEYTVTIQNRDTAEPICTLRYSEWGPNTRDSDLHNQYSATMDNRYVYSSHDGRIFGWDHGQMVERQKSYTQKLASPVVRVFDVARPMDVEEKDPQLIILPQPVGPMDKENIYNSFGSQNRIFVNHTEAGGWFAMSETTYPLVTGGAKTAQCYDPEWLDVLYSARPMTLAQKQESFVGVHSLFELESWRESGLTISGPPTEVTEEHLESANAVSAPLQSVPSIGRSRIVKGAYDNAMDIFLLIVFSFLCTVGFVNRRGISKSLRKLEINPDIPIIDPPTASVPPSPQVTETPWTEEALPERMGKVEEALENDDGYIRVTPPGNTSLEPLQESSRNRSNSVDDSRGRTGEEKGVRFSEPSPGPEEEENGNPDEPVKKKARRGIRGGKNRKRRSNSKTDKSAVGQTVQDVMQIAREPPIEPKVVRINTDGTTDMTDPSGPIVQIGHLKVFTDTVLGFGSHGTMVYKGTFGGRDVAVKRMLLEFYDIASHEVGLLQESDDHQNVIRYYDKESAGDFLYIALELCPASLQEVIEKPCNYPSLVGQDRLDPISTLKQITSGLRYLHTLKIVHRDIKPQNILIAAPKLVPANPSASQPPRLLISDFGLCKKLEGDQNSFRATTAYAAGTSGWRAPELLVDEDLLPNASPATQNGPIDPRSYSKQGDINNSEPLVLDPSTNRRATRAIDIFSLGCVFYYVLTSGCHPFDKDGKYMREANIVKGLYNIDDLSLLGDYQWEAKELISSMLSHNPRARPDAAAVLTHPFFWSPADRLEFLTHVSDAFEFEPRDPPSAALQHLESFAPCILAEARGNDFLLALPKEFLVTLGKQRKYTGGKVLDLLRALRNKKHHYEDMPEALKEKIGGLPKGYLEYWTHRFPSLLMCCWRCVGELGWGSRDRFRTFYESAT